MLQVSSLLSKRFSIGFEYRNTLLKCTRLCNNNFTLDNAIISTSEHLAPFNHIETISFTWLQQLLMASKLAPQKDIIIFAGSLIPLDNRDYPRGFYIPGNTWPVKKYNIWSQSQNKALPLALPPVEFSQYIPEKKIEKYFKLLPSCETNPSYAHQLAEVMSLISSSWFPNLVDQVKVFPLESIASKMLLHLIENEDRFVCDLLFNSVKRNTLQRCLDGVFCAWSATRGSFLFWGVSDKKRLVPLKEENNTLVGKDFSVSLNRNSITKALRNRAIYPGVVISLFLVSWLPSLPIAGGPKQYFYWRRMIEAFNQVFDKNNHRSLALSVHGYNHIDIADLVSKMGGSKYGSGISLLGIEDIYFDIKHEVNRARIIQPIDIVYD